LDVVRLEIFGELRVLHADGGEGLALWVALDLEEAVQPLVRQRDVLDLVGPDELLELAVGDRIARLELQEERLRQREEQEEAQDVPHRASGSGAGAGPAFAGPA